jgi:hypothetical protein
VIAQEQIPIIPCAIALDNERKMIAFNRPPSLPIFVDIRGNITAMWDKKVLKIDEQEYAYNTFFSVADSNSVLHKYFKELIISDRQEPVVFSF